MEKKFLELSREDRILILAINNPPHNSLNDEIFWELYSCRDLILSPDIDLIIFTGKGNVFSKGFDLNAIRAYPDSSKMRESLKGANRIYSFIEDLDKPVIAAINGHCFGGGLELALVCHFRLCSEKARLGLPEVSVKIIPGLGGIHRLAKVVGETKALELITLGDLFSASEALRLNIVNRLFPKKDFMPSVLRFAKTLLMADQGCIREVIRLIKKARISSEQENIKSATDSFIDIYFGRDGD
ncbi:enoyl-CoA hydratase/isomerase family protein [bacterium]|nr:enoyl-CoA hydratase/isomerase family protein [bacterium]MBU1614328.1 enoyl-CoA hydratase/isomerase family protein [bacterium]